MAALDELVALIRAWHPEVGDISPATLLSEISNGEFAAAVLLLMREQYGVTATRQQMEGLHTMADLAALVEELRD